MAGSNQRSAPSKALPWAAVAVGGVATLLVAPKFWPTARRATRRLTATKYSTPPVAGARPNADPARGRPA